MFLRKLFRKKRTKTFFDYDWVEFLNSKNPEHFSKEAVSYVENINENDKSKISKTIEVYQESLIPLFNFWKTDSYAFAIAQNEPTKLFKSYAELNIIEWMFLINMLRKKGVNENVIECLFYIIQKSFDSYGQQIFSKDNFGNFENLVIDRTKIYPSILNYFINPRENESESYSNLFTLIIEKPMEKEIDLYSENLMNFGKLERMQSSMSFIKILSKTLSKFNERTEKIW